MIKKATLLISVLGSTASLISKNSVLLGICDDDAYGCRTNLNYIEHISYFFVLVFLFSLITYFTPARTFQSWWKFARIAIPVCFILSAIILYDASKSTDFFDKVIYMPALTLIYGVFTIGSTWQIWKGFRQK